MAGMRRRSRISEPQRPTAGESGVSDDNAKVVEVAESVDNDSPRPPSPVDRSTKGVCRRCGSMAGEFYNSWLKITNSYHLPTLPGSYRSFLREHGRQKPATMGTVLVGW